MYKVLVVLALLALPCVLAQCGWEGETRVDVKQLDKAKKEIMIIGVRQTIPTSDLSKITLDLKGAADDCTKENLFGASKKANKWAWTVDGVMSNVVHEITKGGTDILYNTDWFSTVQKYNEAHASAKITPSCKSESVTLVNAWLEEEKGKIKVTKIMQRRGGLQPVNPFGITEYHRNGKKKDVWSKECHRDKGWQGWKTSGGELRQHDLGWQGILELKTAAPTGDPLNAATFSDHRTGWQFIHKCVLADGITGSIKVEIDSDKHWELTIGAGKKFDIEKDVQFTHNAALEALGATDIYVGWPEPVITAGMSDYQKGLQRYLLKQTYQDTRYDKNSQSPFIKQSCLDDAFAGLNNAEPFKTQAPKFIKVWVDHSVDAAWADAKAGKFDKFLQACAKLAQKSGEEKPSGAFISCAAPYARFDNACPRPFTSANTKHYITVEERKSNSKASKFPFITEGDAATVVATYTADHKLN